MLMLMYGTSNSYGASVYQVTKLIIIELTKCVKS